MDTDEVKKVNDRSWKDSMQALTTRVLDASGSPDAEHALAVIQARAAVSTRLLAIWTGCLAGATVVLAIATIVIAVRSG